MLLKEFLDFDIYHINTANINDVCSGNNEKQTLVVIGQNDYSPESQELLTKVFQAVKYDLKQDTLMCLLTIDDNVALSQIMQQYEVQRVILFGIESNKIHLNIRLPNYKPTVWNNITLLKTDPLSKISKSKSLKGALWQALKVMF